MDMKELYKYMYIYIYNKQNKKKQLLEKKLK